MKKTLTLAFAVLFLISCDKKIDEAAIPVSETNTLLTQSVDELNKLIVPMTHEPLQLTDAELAYFDRLKTAPIIGLGEATHGTKEFFQMKHRLFKYFVEHFGHKFFAFEMDFSEALIFDEYVQTGKGDIEELIKSKMYFWTWRTSEVKELLIWMKDYNVGKPAKDRVHIYGIDCQTMLYNIPELKKRLNKTDAKLGQKVNEMLSADLGMDENVFLQINELIKSNKANLITKSSLEEYKFIEQISNITVQTYNYINENGAFSDTRDKAMAENVVWLKSMTDSPVSVWAHNAHVQNTDGSSGAGRMMGYFINNIIQGGYKSVGFTFGNGTVTNFNSDDKKFVAMNITKEDVKGFANELFLNAKIPNYFYNLSELYRKPNLREYLSKTPFLYTGGGFSSKDPLYKQSGNTAFKPLIEANFDLMINFSTMTHSDSYLLR